MDTYCPKEVISTATPIVNIECNDAFQLLSEKEKKFCYYFSKACWAGYKVCTFERSYESPALLVLIKIMFGSGTKDTKQRAVQAGLSQDEWDQLVVYCASCLT